MKDRIVNFQLCGIEDFDLPEITPIKEVAPPKFTENEDGTVTVEFGAKVILTFNPKTREKGKIELFPDNPDVGLMLDELSRYKEQK